MQSLGLWLFFHGGDGVSAPRWSQLTQPYTSFRLCYQVRCISAILPLWHITIRHLGLSSTSHDTHTWTSARWHPGPSETVHHVRCSSLIHKDGSEPPNNQTLGCFHVVKPSMRHLVDILEMSIHHIFSNPSLSLEPTATARHHNIK